MTGRLGALAILMGIMTCAAGPGPLPVDSAGAKQEAEKLNSLPPISPTQARDGIDRSGRSESGRASYYAKSFANRKMADGHRMDPRSNAAASKTLPLGTVAKVTNTENGKTVTVRIEDRGPFAKGRVVDLAPKVADQLDLKKKGVAPVLVKPITLPQPDGVVKLGAGAGIASPAEVKQAVEATQAITGSKSTETADK